jgi:hypothetical protein
MLEIKRIHVVGKRKKERRAKPWKLEAFLLVALTNDFFNTFIIGEK